MPNEPVQCPNCGGGEVGQLAPESYLCEHCHTRFHWVDPTTRTIVQKTETTIVHKKDVCACGNIATAFCYRCGLPLCDLHKPGKYKKMGNAEAIFFFWSQFGKGELPEWIQRSLEADHVPHIKSDVILCRTCANKCESTRQAILEKRDQLAKQGQACGGDGSWGGCLSPDVSGRCIICGEGVCSEHGTGCERCHQIVCGKHVVNGKLCSRCSQNYSRYSQSYWMERLWKWLGLGK